MGEKIVLYLGGGGMAGVFGAGVVTTLQEYDLYDCVSTVYGTSAGAFNGAYFLSKQTAIASTVFVNDLVQGFIDVKNIPRAIFSLLFHPDRFSGGEEVMHIDKLFAITQKEKPLDLETLWNQPTPFFVKLLNIESGEVEYHDGKKETWDILKAAVCGIPYTEHTVTIDGKRYADAGIHEPIGLKGLRDRHPTEKLVLAVNYVPSRGRAPDMQLRIEGRLTSKKHGIQFLNDYSRWNERWWTDISEIRRDPRILMVAPGQGYRCHEETTAPDILRESFRMGQKAAEKIIPFIDGDAHA